VTDDPEAPPVNKTARDKAALIVQMTKEAKRVERRTGAKACIVICMFEDEGKLTVQDAGMFPMPPEQFYNIMQQAHSNGQLDHLNGKKPRIIKPH
jgi:hypothetical protein